MRNGSLCFVGLDLALETQAVLKRTKSLPMSTLSTNKISMARNQYSVLLMKDGLCRDTLRT